MNPIDIVFVVCLLAFLFAGIKHGLVKQIVSFCVVYFGISLSLRFSGIVAEWIMKWIHGSPLAVKIISFVIVLFVIALILNLIGKLVEKIISISLLGWLNKLLGALIAVFVYLIVISVITFFFDSVNSSLHLISKQVLAESKTYSSLLDFANLIFPYLKELF